MPVAQPWNLLVRLFGAIHLDADQRGGEEDQRVEQGQVRDAEARLRHVRSGGGVPTQIREPASSMKATAMSTMEMTRNGVRRLSMPHQPRRYSCRKRL
jgi:hypothetical protein